MNNFISLKILDKFKFLYEKLGVDYDVMRLILSTKLTIYSRKTSTSSNYNTSSSRFNFSLLIYLFISFAMMLIMLLNMLSNNSVFMTMVSYFSMFIVFMFLNVMSDFSSVLLDIKDNQILGIRGISKKTLNASKLTYTMIYMISLSMLLNVFSLILSVKYSLLFPFLFLIQIILIDIFIIIISGIGYLVVLKLFDGEKLKSAVSFIEILVVILFCGASFCINIITKNVSLFESIDLSVISYLLAPFWFAAPLEIISTGNINQELSILSLLAFIIPIISFLVYMKLTPTFEKELKKLNNEDIIKNSKKLNLTLILSKIICKDKEERIFFNFISNIIKKDRNFKFRIYPIIMINCILPPFYFIYDMNNEYINPYIYLFIYMCLISIPIIMFELKFSTNHTASYIYTTTPIKNKMSIHKAAIKACLFNIIIPLFIFQSVIIISVCNVNIIHHIVVIFLVSIFIFIVSFKILKKSMPFSHQVNPFTNVIISYKDINPFSSDAELEYCLIFILIFIMAIVHLLISFTGIKGISIYMIAIFILDITLYRSTFIVYKNKM